MGVFKCMAIALVSLAKDMEHSVFSWQIEDLDTALFLGDNLYAYLRDNNKISGGSDVLLVSDLPKE